MKERFRSGGFLLLALLLMIQEPERSDALSNAFTYQGQLQRLGSPVNATCTFQFQLWDAASGGSQILPTLTPAVPITNGLFTVSLDFGSAPFGGSDRFLQIAVQCPSDGGFTVLNQTQRQQLTASPYALFAGAASVAHDTTLGGAGTPASPLGVPIPLRLGTGAPLADVFLVGDTIADLDGLRVHYNKSIRTGVIDVKGTNLQLRGESGGTGAGGTSRLYIDLSNGRVGVGTTSPQETLHVQGTARVSSLFHAPGPTLPGCNLAAVYADPNGNLSSTCPPPLNAANLSGAKVAALQQQMEGLKAENARLQEELREVVIQVQAMRVRQDAVAALR